MKTILLMIALFSTSLAHAQGPGMICSGSTSSTPTVRADGYAERVSDFIITCTGGTPTINGGMVPAVNLTVFVNTNITSQMLAAAGAPGDWSEALLLIGTDGAEPSGTATTAGNLRYCTSTGCTMKGVGAPGGANYLATDSQNTNPANVFQGRQSGANQIIFMGVPVDPPGNGHTRTLRITNIRANPNTLAYSLTIPTSILMVVNSTGFAIGNNMQTIAMSLGGLVTGCEGSAKSSGVSFRENFASSFKTGGTAASNIPGANQTTENGFYNKTFAVSGANNFIAAVDQMTSNINNAGLAFAGTRLMVTFNEPSNQDIWLQSYIPLVDTATGNISGYAALVGGTLTAPNPLPTTASESTLTKVTVAAGVGSAVYEIMLTSLTKVEDLSIPFFDSTGKSLTFTGTADINLATSGGSGAASLTAPVPRFNATPTKTWTIGP